MSMKRAFVCGTLVLLSSVFSAAAPGAQAPVEPPEHVALVARQNAAANAEAAGRLGLPLGDIQACRAAGFSLFMAMIQADIAKQSGLSVQDVIAGRIEGYSWGEMAATWGFSMEVVAQQVTTAYQGMQEAGLEIPPETTAESRRSVGTGKRQKPLRPKP